MCDQKTKCIGKMYQKPNHGCIVAVVVMGDDPLKGMSADSLKQELDSVSLDWKPLRSVKACPCFTHFDHFMNKVSKNKIL